MAEGGVEDAGLFGAVAMSPGDGFGGFVGDGADEERGGGGDKGFDDVEGTIAGELGGGDAG